MPVEKLWVAVKEGNESDDFDMKIVLHINKPDWECLNHFYSFATQNIFKVQSLPKPSAKIIPYPGGSIMQWSTRHFLLEAAVL